MIERSAIVAVSHHDPGDEQIPDIPWPESIGSGPGALSPARRAKYPDDADNGRPILAAVTSGAPTLVDLMHIAANPPPERRWFVDGLFPFNANVLLGAHGGTGKSKVMLHAAVCMALGIDFFGQKTRQATGVVVLSCEDDQHELHRQLPKICASLKVDLTDLHGRLFIFDAVGCDAALFGRRQGRSESGGPLLTAAPDATAMFDWLADFVTKSGSEVVILDSLSDTFDGSENDRAQVRRYMTLALSLVTKFRGCVIHVAHVDKVAARYGQSGAAGQNYAGSTAMNNSVRVRIAMMGASALENEPGGRGEDDGRRLLVVEKSNYSRAGLTIPLRFDPELEVFVRDAEEPSGMVGVIRDQAERKALLRLLLECERLDKVVNTAEKANHNASVILGEMDGFPRALKTKPGRARLWSHIRRLADEKLIEAEPFKTPSRKPSERWKVTPAGRNEATQP